MKAILGKKIGMTSLFSENGDKVPVTVLKVLPSYVLQLKKNKQDGYDAVVVGSVSKKEKNIAKPQLGLFKKVKCEPLGNIFEVKADNYDEYKLGQAVGIEILENAKAVNVTSYCKGRGFSGTIKRHNFSRGRETHGNKNHRAPGSIGQCAQPSKVWKGQKLPGRYGNTKKTVKNLKVMEILKDQGLLMVKGAVPGPKNNFVKIAVN